jgi:tRNA A-37 threonylcarbamoyl transferase component Bud32
MTRVGMYSNTANLGGGAVSVVGGSAMLEEVDMLQNGTAGDGAAIRTQGTVTLSRSSVRGNLDLSPIGQREAIAVVGGGTLFVLNSTLAGNNGNGVDVDDGTLDVENSTIFGNAQRGIEFQRIAGRTLFLRNTILSGNTDGGCTLAGAGAPTISTDGYNFTQAYGCAIESGGTNAVTADAQLGALVVDPARYTAYYLPQAGSPVRDTGHPIVGRRRLPGERPVRHGASDRRRRQWLGALRHRRDRGRDRDPGRRAVPGQLRSPDEMSVRRCLGVGAQWRGGSPKGASAMAQSFDLAVLDAELEALLDLSVEQRSERLERIERTTPDLAATLRRLLSIAATVHTSEIRQVGASLRLVSEEAPAPVIAGYRITGEIGRGGMATVYAAVRDVHGTNQNVAIKILRAAILSPLERERFLNEQRILARLTHPNIATLLEVGTVDDRPYMVMERIEGEPIDARLQPTVADLPAILDAIGQAADAVQLAHEHFIIHRDIKPDNLLIDKQGRIKLIDFGIAKILDESGGLRADPTVTGAAPLTLRYASPEQLLNRPIGVGSDIYQLGLLLYHLATGAWPYDDGQAELQLQRARADVMAEPASRRVSDPALRRALQGDLDSILLEVPRVRSRAALPLGRGAARGPRAAPPAPARGRAAPHARVRAARRSC